MLELGTATAEVKPTQFLEIALWFPFLFVPVPFERILFYSKISRTCQIRDEMNLKKRFNNNNNDNNKQKSRLTLWASLEPLGRHRRLNHNN